MAGYRRRPGLARLRVRALDLFVGVWVLGWLAVGVWVAVDVSHLDRLARTLGTAAAGLADVAAAVKKLAGVPFVGGTFRHLAANAARTAASARASAASSRTSVEQLAYLLGIVICLVPSVPVVAVWLPMRVAHARQVRAIRRALADPRHRAGLKRYLAERALAGLPFHQLARLSDDPWEDVRTGHLDALAGAELERLGLAAELLDTPAPNQRRYRP